MILGDHGSSGIVVNLEEWSILEVGALSLSRILRILLQCEIGQSFQQINGTREVHIPREGSQPIRQFISTGIDK